MRDGGVGMEGDQRGRVHEVRSFAPEAFTLEFSEPILHSNLACFLHSKYVKKLILFIFATQLYSNPYAHSFFLVFQRKYTVSYSDLWSQMYLTFRTFQILSAYHVISFYSLDQYFQTY